MTNIKQNILATMAYYDVLDLPLTAAEICARLINFKHLSPQYKEIQSPYIEEVREELDRLTIDGIVNQTREYYFLFDREYLVPLRLKRQKTAAHKWHKTRQALRLLRLVPHIKVVFASGSLAIENTDELSDLDVLIVVTSGRIWLARLFMLVILSIFNMRRKGRDRIAPEKICPNHFITDDSLGIPFHSLYNAQTYSNLVPIYSREHGIIEKFKKANDWTLDYVQNWNINSLKIGPRQPMFVEIIEWLLEICGAGSLLNKEAGQYQSRRISKNRLTKESGGRVVFNDKQLEFHPHSIEKSIIKKYNENLTKLGMADLAVERDSGLIE